MPNLPTKIYRTTVKCDNKLVFYTTEKPTSYDKEYITSMLHRQEILIDHRSTERYERFRQAVTIRTKKILLDVFPQQKGL